MFLQKINISSRILLLVFCLLALMISGFGFGIEEFNKINQDIQSLSQENLPPAQLKTLAQNIIQKKQTVFELMNFIAVFNVIIALLFAFVISKSIISPLNKAVKVANKISSGEKNIQFPKESRDEVGQLMQAINSMLTALNQAHSKLEKINFELEEKVKERTKELAEKNQLLEQSNKELDDFAYIASHDLKEPLRGINNYASFLLEDYSDKLDDDGKTKLETLKRLTKRLESFIDALLYYSRVGRTNINWEECDLNTMVDEIKDSLHVTLEEKGIEIRIPQTLPHINCDKIHTTELFRNLITNAMKYNDKEEKWIEVGYSINDKNIPVFHVRDNGIGIKEKHLDSVFRIFKRLHGRDKFGGGTGVGLTIVKKVVEKHGGKIWLESEFGQGTTFYFTLGTSKKFRDPTGSTRARAPARADNGARVENRR